MSETECRHLPEPVWNPDRCDKCGAIVRRPGIAWTSDPPTVPGHYLCAYRWDSDSPWVTNYIRIAGSPVDPDISDTRWFGPIPAIEPAKGGGG
jgi:hypothetical protein